MPLHEGHLLMLHNVVLILLGLVLFGVLATILETLGLKNHPYVARTLSAIIIAVAAYINWGYHTWWTVLIVVAFGFAYLQILKQYLGQSAKKNT
jgi:hypothetical protein